MIEEYKKIVDDTIEKEMEAFDKFNDVRNENQEYVEKILLPNNGNLAPEQKQKEQDLLEKVREAGDELIKAIDERENL